MASITLGTNIFALGAQRKLTEHTQTLRESYTALSSGLRINSPRDDAAGLTIATLLGTDSKVFRQGLRNVNDGLGLLSVASGATAALSDILIRVRELSTQASNGTLGAAQRGALDSEAQALLAEYNRIVDTTSFNGLRLFGPGADTASVQAGYGTDNLLQLRLSTEITTVAGDGTFQSAIQSPVGLAGDLLAGDFNGDGEVDLIASLDTTTSILVLLGDGSGSFTQSASFSSGVSSPFETLVAADFNGDGRLDFAHSSDSDDVINVFLGNGDGTFGAAVATTSIIDPLEMRAADVNGDGKVDLITGESFLNVHVLFGNGDGTFGAPATYASPGGFRGVTLADANNDSVLDLLVSAYAGGDSRGLEVYLGNGDGTYQAAITSLVDVDSNFPVAGDLNGDGNIDLVSGGYLNGNLYVSLGNGDGTFADAAVIATGHDTTDIHLTDVDGDTDLDIVSLHNSVDNIKFHLNDGTGSFTAGTPIDNPSGGGFGLELADINHDTVLDLLESAPSKIFAYLANTQVTSQGVSLERISGISLATQLDARTAQGQIDGYLDTLNTVRAGIGALESRLQVAAEGISSSAVYHDDAMSRILDADIAEESSLLVNAQILQQASAAVLGQANIQPALALRLLS